jgi:hypothetical protein
VEKVLEAFILPALLIEKSPEFVKLMGRVYAEGLMPEIARRNFQPTVNRFLDALRRALPEIPAIDLRWKVHFALGSMAHAVMSRPETGHDVLVESPGDTAKRLVAFISSGFRAPALPEKETEVSQ